MLNNSLVDKIFFATECTENTEKNSTVGFKINGLHEAGSRKAAEAQITQRVYKRKMKKIK